MAGFHNNNCCVYGCRNKQFDVKFTFFPLPTDVERRAAWLKAIGRNDLLGSGETMDKVCSKHFGKTAMSEFPLQKLMPDAVPSKYLPTSEFLHMSPLVYEHDEDFSDVATQTNVTYGSDRPKTDVAEVFGRTISLKKGKDLEIPNLSTFMHDRPDEIEPDIDTEEPETKKRKL